MSSDTTLKHQSEKYWQRGLLTGVRVISAGAADQYSQQIKQFVSDYSGHPDYPRWTYFKSHLLFSWVAELARSAELVALMQSILGRDILLWNSFIPLKAPRSTGYFGWHQDATYWPLSPVTKLASVWIAFGEVDPSRGGMRAIPGSHLLGQLKHENTGDKKSMLRRGQRIVEAFPEHDALDIFYAPGEASVHHTYTIHGSGPNNSDQWRYALGLNYASADVIPNAGFPDSALYIAGRDRNDSFLRERAATTDLGEDELAEYQRILSHSNSRYEKAV